jgi:hypothetical protein
MMKQFLLYIVVLMLLLGCQSKENKPGYTKDADKIVLAPPDLKSWLKVEENGYTKEKQINEYEYILTFIPNDLIINENEKNINSGNIDSIRKNYEMFCFNFQIKLNGATDELLKYNLSSSYEDRIRYVSFKMENDIKLIDNNDSIKVGLFHFERYFNTSSTCNFNISFPSEKIIKSKSELVQFCFYDKLFNNGVINFTFNKNIFTQQPKIKFV